MEVKLKIIPFEEKEALRNLLEKYDYEFSLYDKLDVNNFGLYGYEDFDHYWSKENRWPYFILVDDTIAGFVMISDKSEVKDRGTSFVISEFFVMRKYQRMGIGKQIVFQVLDLHKGTWQLKLHPKNLPSVHFWSKVIDEYTKGAFEKVDAYPGTEYNDGTLADLYFFSS